MVKRRQARQLQEGLDKMAHAQSGRPNTAKAGELELEGGPEAEDLPLPPKVGAQAKRAPKKEAQPPAVARPAYPAGKMLSGPEIKLSSRHAPTDRNGKRICWDFSSHMGCKKKACDCANSHEPLKWLKDMKLLKQSLYYNCYFGKVKDILNL